jgi:hypothetical protein
MKKSILFLVIAVLSCQLLTVSCKKNEGPKPTLPPKESMVQDLKLGNHSKALSATASDTAWTDASIRVGVWNVILFVTLAIPVGSFVKAFEYSPKWDKNLKAWVWKYDFPVGLLKYDAELQGKVNGDSTEWKMYLTHDNDFQDFLWYEGWSNVNDKGGRWILYESPTKTNQLLGIYWSKNLTDNTATITYRNICPPSVSPYGSGNGGYISYGTQTGEFDRFYTIYESGTNNTAKILWNYNDEHGRITDTIRYHSVWRCWDQAQQDVNCN